MPKRLFTFSIVCFIGYLAIRTWLILREISLTASLGVDGTSPMSDFWDIQFSGAEGSLVADIIALILFSSIGAFLFIYSKNNHVFKMIQVRIGYTKFLNKATFYTFSLAAIVSILTKLYELTVFIILLHQWPSNIMTKAMFMLGRNPLSDNTWLGFVTYIVISGIGWGIYSCLILAIGLFVRKNAVYLSLGAIVGIILIILPGFLAPLAGKSLAAYVYVWFLPVLIAPGQMYFSISNGFSTNIYIAYLISGVSFLLISWLLIRLWVKQQSGKG